VVYESRRVYIEYVVWYKSDRSPPVLPPVPKICISGRHAGSTTYRLRRTSSDEEHRPSSDDSEGISDSDDDDDEDVNYSRRRSTRTLRRTSVESPNRLRRCSSSENVTTERQDAMNDYYTSSSAQTRDDSVIKVSATRKRTQALLQAHGWSSCLLRDTIAH